MSFLTTVNEKHFHQTIPAKPMGKYAHIVACRVAESYPLFQTDGALNTARVRAGLKKDNNQPITRLVMFKRKQSTPERLAGRELLRRYELVSMDSPKGGKKKVNVAQGAGYGECDYNVNFCQHCADCILYGFAIGDSGSEKSKVVVDSAFSLTPFEDSHVKVTLNAPFEDGTMSRGGDTTSRINSQDHIIPQTFFPSIVTIKDPTEAGFLYVLNNLLRTKHYGAQTTRTGRMRNVVLGIVFADGEISSNLRLTQAVYDLLSEGKQISLPDPIQEENVTEAISKSLPQLLKDDGVAYELIHRDDLQKLLSEVASLTQNETSLRKLLSAVNGQANEYASRYVKTDKKAE